MTENKSGAPYKKSILHTTGILILKGMAFLPFWIVYGLSDFLAFLLRYVVRYRKKVIFGNLRNSFPEFSETEIRRLAWKFYRHFADITLESVKGYGMTRADFDARMVFKGLEEMNALAEQGKSVLLLGFHYNNWEWSGFAQIYLKHRYLVVYNPMRGNPQFEEYLLGIRRRWGAETIPVHKSARATLEFDRKQEPVALVLAADQRPPAITRFWASFMNQEASFNQGPGKIAKKTNQPVFLHLTRKISRGHYEVSFIPLIMDPREVSEEEIMLTYVRAMERYIREEPAWYLWSHRRWKQQRPDGYAMADDLPGVGEATRDR